MRVEEKRLTKVKEEVATEDDKLKKVHISQGPAWYLIFLLGFCKWFQRSIFPRTCFLSDLFLSDQEADGGEDGREGQAGEAGEETEEVCFFFTTSLWFTVYDLWFLVYCARSIKYIYRHHILHQQGEREEGGGGCG